MAGKTISAYTDNATAERIELIAQREQRRKAQIAGTAVKFFVGLSDEARAAWLQIEALGSAVEIEKLKQDIARTILDAQYQMVHRQIMDEIQTAHLGTLNTEDEILETAVNLTRD
jgi:predicted transcriptional regulator